MRTSIIDLSEIFDPGDVPVLRNRKPKQFFHEDNWVADCQRVFVAFSVPRDDWTRLALEKIRGSDYKDWVLLFGGEHKFENPIPWSTFVTEFSRDHHDPFELIDVFQEMLALKCYHIEDFAEYAAKHTALHKYIAFNDVFNLLLLIGGLDKEDVDLVRSHMPHIFSMTDSEAILSLCSLDDHVPDRISEGDASVSKFTDRLFGPDSPVYEYERRFRQIKATFLDVQKEKSPQPEGRSSESEDETSEPEDRILGPEDHTSDPEEPLPAKHHMRSRRKIDFNKPWSPVVGPCPICRGRHYKRDCRSVPISGRVCAVFAARAEPEPIEAIEVSYSDDSF